MAVRGDDTVGVASAALHTARGRADRRLVAMLDELEPAAVEPTSQLAAATRAFGLSPGQVQALALTAAVEIDVRIGVVLRRMQGLADAVRPTAATLAELCQLDVVADLGPAGPLRRHRLIELHGDAPLPFQVARCPEAVWSRLCGVRGETSVAPDDPDRLVIEPELRAAIAELGAWLAASDGVGTVVVWGPPGSGRHAIAGAIAGHAGLRHRRVDATDLADREACAAIERDTRWAGDALIITSDAAVPAPVAAAWLAAARVPRLWVQREPPEWLVDTVGRSRSLEVAALGLGQRAAIWKRALSSSSAALDARAVAARYRFGPGRIERVLELIRDQGREPCPATIATATRATSRPGISSLAQRLPARDEDDLIVAPAVRRELTLAFGWARTHAVLYDSWGLTSGTSQARGVSCLFAGRPGTGKTLATQIMAGKVDRDLFRVDLSQAVSKWLGETEKNLARLFDEAQDAGAILFFDEADALFATRTQVRDAHDRWANLETGFLLQRLETHDGIVVLASNRRQDLDVAFQRRFDVIVEFEPPKPAERLQLWQRHLPAPPRTSTDVDTDTLSNLFELSGGQIRNAILAAIAMTAERDGGGDHLAMPSLIQAGTRELVRAGRLVNPAEFGEWADAVRAALPGGAT